MAKIPMGNTPRRLPQSSPITPTAGPDMQVGDAIARVGNVAMGLGANMLAEQERESKIAADRAAQVQTLTAHANIQNGLAESYDALSRDVLEGKTDKIAATATWKEASEKVVADNLKAVPADRQQLVAAQVKGLEGQLQGKLFDTFRKRDQQDVAAGLITYREQQERFASTDPAAAVKQYGTFVDQMAPGAGWTPEQAARAKQTFVEGVTYNQFRGAAQGAMQTGSIDALDQVQQRLAGKEGDALDPAKRNQLDQTIFGWKQSIEAKAARGADKAEREATKRYNGATDLLNKNRDIALGGGYIAPEQIALISEQVAEFPDLKAQANELFASQKVVAGFASQPPNVRAATLESARAARANPGVGIDPLGQQQLTRAEQIDSSLRQKVESGEAWSAAQSVGVISSAPLLNIGNPQEAVAVLQKRLTDIGAVEAWAGRKVSPLQPEEAAQLTKMVRTLKPDQAASLLGQAGAALGDSERIAALAKQIGDKDGTLGMAMAFANAKTTEGRYTAELVLEGDQKLRDKVVKADGIAETGWKSTIAKEVRGAYSNQEVETTIIDAAFKIAAATDGDVKRAIRLATGGGIIERNGGRIPMPYGMKEDDFDKRIAGFTPEALAPQTPGGAVMVGPNRVPVADFVKTLPDARLVHAGQGLYNVRAGNQLVTNEAGKRITLKVGP